MDTMINFPQCQQCHTGVLVPFSDFGGQGASVMFKAWVCINPDCFFNLKIRNGDVYVNERVTDAEREPRPVR